MVVGSLAKGEAAEVVDHDVAEGFYDLARVGGGEADDLGAGSSSGIDSMEGILEYICLGRLAAEDFHALEEALRIGL